MTDSRWRYTILAGGIALSLIGAGCAGRQGNEAGSGAPSGGATSNAAGPGGPASGAPGGGNSQMAQWRQKFPGTSALMSSVFGVRMLMDSGQHPLTPTQASHVAALLASLPTQGKLSQDDAKKLGDQVDAYLTPDQQTEIGALRQQRRGMGRPGGGGGGYPRGGGAQGGTPGGMAGGGSPGGMKGMGGMKGPGGAGGRQPMFDVNMAPDANPFQKGRQHDMLVALVAKLKADK